MTANHTSYDNNFVCNSTLQKRKRLSNQLHQLMKKLKIVFPDKFLYFEDIVVYSCYKNNLPTREAEKNCYIS